jgi:hypothetical protein
MTDSDLAGLGLAGLGLAGLAPSNAWSTAPVLPCMTVERTPDDPCTR